VLADQYFRISLHNENKIKAKKISLFQKINNTKKRPQKNSAAVHFNMISVLFYA
jgi:hypothetical protein